MDTSLTAWLVIVLITGGLASLAIWSRTRSFVRGLAIVLFAVGIPATGLAALSGLGSAAPPIPGINIPGGDFKVLGIKLIEGEAIYALIDTIGEPTYLRFPWDQDQAEKLQDMMDDPNNGGIVVQIPYEFSWDDNPPQFHPLPVPMDPPPKPPAKKAPHFNGI